MPRNKRTNRDRGIFNPSESEMPELFRARTFGWLWIVWVIFSFSLMFVLGGAAVYVAWHFIAKFW